MDGVAAPSGLAVLRREAPLHALMLVVMGAALVAGTRLAMLGAVGILVLVAIVCAVLARRSGHFVVQCLDLWAMALGMLALVLQPAAGHHGAGAPALVLYSGVVAVWLAARVAFARGRSWRADLLSAALTGAGLALMLALH